MIDPEFQTPTITLEECILEKLTFFDTEFPKRAVFLEPWLQEKSLTLVSGFRGAGKTWFGLGLFDSISRGAPFGPWQTPKPVTSLYLEGEMSSSEIHKRWTSFSYEDKYEYETPMYLYSEDHVMGRAVEFNVPLPRADLTSPEWRAHMEKILDSKGVQLFGIDNLASLCPGIDENSKQDWDSINAWLLGLRFKGISIIMFHHVNKAGGQRGTSAREDNVDNSILLTLPADYSPSEGCRFNVEFTKARALSEEDKKDKCEPYEFTLQNNGHGTIWTTRKVAKCHEEQVLSLLQCGAKQSDIALELGISPPTVSRIVTRLKSESRWEGRKRAS